MTRHPPLTSAFFSNATARHGRARSAVLATSCGVVWSGTLQNRSRPSSSLATGCTRAAADDHHRLPSSSPGPVPCAAYARAPADHTTRNTTSTKVENDRARTTSSCVSQLKVTPPRTQPTPSACALHPPATQKLPRRRLSIGRPVISSIARRAVARRCRRRPSCPAAGRQRRRGSGCTCRGGDRSCRPSAAARSLRQRRSWRTTSEQLAVAVAVAASEPGPCRRHVTTPRLMSLLQQQLRLRLRVQPDRERAAPPARLAMEMMVRFSEPPHRRRRRVSAPPSSLYPSSSTASATS